jgi:hypothetical protein
MYGFFGFLQPEFVFQQFHGVPSSEELGHLVEECRNNLKFGKQYVGAKLLAMSVVAAFAILTGGDEAPLSLFTGDLNHVDNARVGSMFHSVSSNELKMMYSRELPEASPEQLEKCTTLVYHILAEGRRSETTFDIKRSPWAAYLYGVLGDDQLNRILNEQPVFPMTEEHAWSLLRALPLEDVEVIADDMSDVALSRAESIRQILAEL